MLKFTDALDEYLEAKKIYDFARENFQGYDFEYHYHKENTRLRESKEALNKFFEEKESTNEE